MVRPGSGIEPNPSSSPIRRCSAGPWPSNEAAVPAPPPSIATKIRGSICRSRSVWRHSSSIHTATFAPKVAGTACWPCVRPAIASSFVRSARLANASSSPAISASTIRCALRTCSRLPVWVMFCVVAPQWT